MENNFKLVRIIADVEDKQDLLIEHSLLNRDENYLTHCMVKVEGDYYWLVSEDVGSVVKFATDDDSLICPCCKESLFIKGIRSDKVRTHLSHRKNSTNNCEFKTRYNCESKLGIIEQGESLPESQIHYNLKREIELLIKHADNFGYEIFLSKVKNYRISTFNYHSIIDYEYEPVKIVGVEVEKQIVKKEDGVAGFRADLNVYDEHGQVHFIEVTNTNGKTLDQYYKSWERGYGTVYEVKAKKTNFLTPIKLVNCMEDNTLIFKKHLFANQNIEINLLYDPMKNEGLQALVIAEKENAKRRRGDIFTRLNKFITKALRKSRVYKKQSKNGNWWHYNSKDEYMPNEKYKVVFMGEPFNVFVPKEVAQSLFALGINVKHIPKKMKEQG